MRRTTWCSLLGSLCLFAGFAPPGPGSGTEQGSPAKGEPAPGRERERFQTAPAAPTAAEPTGAAQIRREAEALRPLVSSGLARDFLRAAANIPAVAPRTVYRDAARRSFFSEADARRLGEQRRKALSPIAVDETFYYTTKYGSPLAYARPIELLGRAGVNDAGGLRVLDFGYGTIGHLRLLASLGSDVTGVDVDPLLRALYSGPGDQGVLKGPMGREGRVTLIEGRYPADEATRTAVGGDYDLILSKNTLKNGYIHPDRPVDRRLRIDLGVSDEAFVRAFHAALKPGGQVLIYNISPAQSPPDQPYRPWADGRCPFPKALWESVGFRVEQFDRDDSPAARALGHALGWDRGEGATDLERDVHARYTLVEKPRKN
jgi:hypothetical protein